MQIYRLYINIDYYILYNIYNIYLYHKLYLYKLNRIEIVFVVTKFTHSSISKFISINHFNFA